ncbi:MAG: polymer-forming cytoskeletal protein [Candidatus Kerfeldbacteria bacterium]|nr:polymer-forming cytoskeletal protein [Candidatus Kerfeldbacteria bacterium]
MKKFMSNETEETKNDVAPLSGEVEVETVIGPSVKVEGDFVGEDNVDVEGVVIGNLKTSKNLRIGEGARVEADVFAENVYIAGEVIGNLKIKNKTELARSAKIVGDLETAVLSIETGAVLKGKCISGTSSDELIELSAKRKESKKPKRLDEIEL